MDSWGIDFYDKLTYCMNRHHKAKTYKWKWLWWYQSRVYRLAWIAEDYAEARQQLDDLLSRR